MMSDVGIVLSYHPQDSHFAMKLAANLRLAGVRLWVDVLSASEELSVEQAIEQSQAVIVVLSPSFSQALLPATKLDGMNIFPVVCRDLTTWPEGIRRDFAIDFDEWYLADRFELHLKELVRKLDLQLEGVTNQNVSDEQKYLYRLLADLSDVGAYVPLAAHAEPVEDDESLQDGKLVLSVGDSLVERIARNAEMAESMVTSEEGGLIPLASVQAMYRYTKAFVIVGRSGAGKSATLQYLALQAIKERLADANALLPVWADLARWKDGGKFFRFLDDVTGINLQSYFDGQNIALFLDHLEHAGGRNGAWLSKYLEKPDAPDTFVVTADAGIYGDELELPIVSLDLLSESRFEQWQDKQAFTESTRLKTENLRGIVQLPFFFDLMIRSGLRETPRNQSELFQHYLNHCVVDEATRQLLVQRLSRLAVAVIDDDEPLDFDAAWAMQKLGSNKQRGLLRRRGADEEGQRILNLALKYQLLLQNDDKVRFRHVLLHSYFAAQALLAQGVGGMLRAPEFDDQRRVATKWDDAIIMAGQLSEKPDEMILDISTRDPILASICLRSGVNVNDDTRASVRETLIKRLEENDWRSTRAMVQALRHLGETELVELMIENLAYGDLYERKVAASVLGEVGHPAAAPILAAALLDETMRTDAQKALIRIGKPCAKEVIPLLKVSESDRWETRAAAAQILRAIGATEAAPYLAGALYDPEHEVRWSIANALSEFGEVAVPLLIDVLHDDDALNDTDILQAAASALVWMNQDEALGELMGVLRDVVAIRRAVVATVLGQSENPIVVPALIDALSDTASVEFEDEVVSIDELAAESLEQIGTPEALEAVQKWEES